MSPSKIHRKAIKLITSALLAGGFTDHELYMLSSELMHGSAFGAELGLALRQFSDRRIRSSEEGASGRDYFGKALSPDVSTVADLSKRMQITSDELLKIIEGISQPPLRAENLKRLSIKRILNEYFKVNDETHRRLLVNELLRYGSSRKVYGDSYLDFITTKLNQ